MNFKEQDGEALWHPQMMLLDTHVSYSIISNVIKMFQIGHTTVLNCWRALRVLGKYLGSPTPKLPELE